jgi:hypothetical protein
MSDFNETQSPENKQVVVFERYSQAENWQVINCHRCILIQTAYSNEESARCKLGFHIDRSKLLRTVPLWVAKDIGCEYDPLYQTCKLFKSCSEKRKRDEPY